MRLKLILLPIPIQHARHVAIHLVARHFQVVAAAAAATILNCSQTQHLLRSRGEEPVQVVHCLTRSAMLAFGRLQRNSDLISD